MAILAVKIEDTATLKMNEFFDYNGHCYALSCSRAADSKTAADLEDFYDCTVFTDWIGDVPVVFMCEDEKGELWICGWYKQAKIYRQAMHPSLFLEGNIVAKALDAVLLPEEHRICAGSIVTMADMLFHSKSYSVIESDDACYGSLHRLVYADNIHALPVRYELFDVNRHAGYKYTPGTRRPVETNRQAAYLEYIHRCTGLAQRLMGDECQDIGEIKMLREYAKMAVKYSSSEPDGHYYEAMADEQLGFVKEGLKAVNRALALEPDGADIMALKANLLAGLRKYKEAADLYKESYEISGDESYLLARGRVLFLMGDVDGAYGVYRQMTDKQLLVDAGINLKDMERRWPFVAIRGIKKWLKRG